MPVCVRFRRTAIAAVPARYRHGMQLAPGFVCTLPSSARLSVQRYETAVTHQPKVNMEVQTTSMADAAATMLLLRPDAVVRRGAVHQARR